MASHLLLSDWISERFRPEPVLIDQGYPLGPHALVAGLAASWARPRSTSSPASCSRSRRSPRSSPTGRSTGVRPVARVLASACVALPYLAAAYLAQEAFKEPIIALFVLAFALLLTRLRDWRSAIPLGLLAAGVTYVYSFPGLAWLAGTAIVFGGVELWRARRGGRGSARTRDARSRAPAIAVGVGLLTLVLLSLPEAGRLLDFVDFRALHPDRANEGGLGNLPGQLSPLEALGIWPTSDFRLSATASSVPAVVFYAGGLFALVCLALGLPRWIRRNGTAVPSALLAAAILYLAARALGTVYTSAKALAIAAPLVTLVTLGGLLGERAAGADAGRARFGLAAAGSSFLILRQAPVAPEAHADRARADPPAGRGREAALPRSRQLRPLRAPRLEAVHPRAQLLRPVLRRAQLRARGRRLEVRLRLGHRGDARQVPVRAHDPRRVRKRPAARLSRWSSDTDSYVLWRRAGRRSGREPAETRRRPGPARRLSAGRARANDRRSRHAGRRRRGRAGRDATIESGESASVDARAPGRALGTSPCSTTRPAR